MSFYMPQSFTDVSDYKKMLKKTVLNFYSDGIWADDFYKLKDFLYHLRFKQNKNVHITPINLSYGNILKKITKNNSQLIKQIYKILNNEDINIFEKGQEIFSLLKENNLYDIKNLKYINQLLRKELIYLKMDDRKQLPEPTKKIMNKRKEILRNLFSDLKESGIDSSLLQKYKNDLVSLFIRYASFDMNNTLSYELKKIKFPKEDIEKVKKVFFDFLKKDKNLLTINHYFLDNYNIENSKEIILSQDKKLMIRNRKTNIEYNIQSKIGKDLDEDYMFNELKYYSELKNVSSFVKEYADFFLDSFVKVHNEFISERSSWRKKIYLKERLEKELLNKTIDENFDLSKETKIFYFTIYQFFKDLSKHNNKIDIFLPQNFINFIESNYEKEEIKKYVDKEFLTNFYRSYDKDTLINLIKDNILSEKNIYYINLKTYFTNNINILLNKQSKYLKDLNDFLTIKKVKNGIFFLPELKKTFKEYMLDKSLKSESKEIIDEIQKNAKNEEILEISSKINNNLAYFDKDNYKELSKINYDNIFDKDETVIENSLKKFLKTNFILEDNYFINKINLLLKKALELKTENNEDLKKYTNLLKLLSENNLEEADKIMTELLEKYNTKIDVNLKSNDKNFILKRLEYKLETLTSLLKTENYFNENYDVLRDMNWIFSLDEKTYEYIKNMSVDESKVNNDIFDLFNNIKEKIFNNSFRGLRKLFIAINDYLTEDNKKQSILDKDSFDLWLKISIYDQNRENAKDLYSNFLTLKSFIYDLYNLDLLPDNIKSKIDSLLKKYEDFFEKNNDKLINPLTNKELNDKIKQINNLLKNNPNDTILLFLDNLDLAFLTEKFLNILKNNSDKKIYIFKDNYCLNINEDKKTEKKLIKQLETENPEVYKDFVKYKNYLSNIAKKKNKESFANLYTYLEGRAFIGFLKQKLREIKNPRPVEIRKGPWFPINLNLINIISKENNLKDMQYSPLEKTEEDFQLKKQINEFLEDFYLLNKNKKELTQKEIENLRKNIIKSIQFVNKTYPNALIYNKKAQNEVNLLMRKAFSMLPDNEKEKILEKTLSIPNYMTSAIQLISNSNDLQKFLEILNNKFELYYQKENEEKEKTLYIGIVKTLKSDLDYSLNDIIYAKAKIKTKVPDEIIDFLSKIDNSLIYDFSYQNFENKYVDKLENEKNIFIKSLRLEPEKIDLSSDIQKFVNQKDINPEVILTYIKKHHENQILELINRHKEKSKEENKQTIFKNLLKNLMLNAKTFFVSNNIKELKNIYDNFSFNPSINKNMPSIFIDKNKNLYDEKDLKNLKFKEIKNKEIKKSYPLSNFFFNVLSKKHKIMEKIQKVRETEKEIIKNKEKINSKNSPSNSK